MHNQNEAVAYLLADSVVGCLPSILGKVYSFSTSKRRKVSHATSQKWKSACVLPQHPYIGDLTNSENDLPNGVMLGHRVLSTSYGSELMCLHLLVRLRSDVVEI